MVLAMILAMGTTVFATNITFNGEDGRTYVGYKIFNLTTSLKPGDACPEGTQHTDACYNYAYTVNEKYREILQAETLAKAEDEVWEDGSLPPQMMLPMQRSSPTFPSRPRIITALTAQCAT